LVCWLSRRAIIFSRDGEFELEGSQRWVAYLPLEGNGGKEQSEASDY
jgi:hypothetical protein